MTLAAPAYSTTSIDAEWARIDVLAQCLIRSRVGQEPEEKLIQQLSQLQQQVESLRGSKNAWQHLPIQDLDPLALEVLACVYASEVRPQLGWLYQELQPGITQPYITPALIQLLLALTEQEIHTLHALIGYNGELLKRRLIDKEGEGAFALLRPNREALAQLMGWPRYEVPPPGAVCIRQQATWEDLVLPSDRVLALREYMLWLRHRKTVVEDWGGYSLGGPVVLFSGPSGTGKTFAASVIANDLGWPLYRVDLASLVSKYIGETEKNIGRLLDAAHEREMVLQFDEVDALMSKRGEIKEARDRYANMEVSYLLARIEEHRGPCILTTNLRNQIDKAFSRRFQLVVEFPRPDEASRQRLWERMLPPKAPLAPDVNLQFLAQALSLTGGKIRNAALHAAYLAAEDNQSISLTHIAIAVWRELAKERPQIVKSELGALAEYLPYHVTSGAEAT
jgi:DNA polymerase III delta prime subunit